MVALHAVVPNELSKLGNRTKRTRRVPLITRSGGLLAVATGAALIAWAIRTHYQAAPRGWELRHEFADGYLLRSGPYRLSRNPMYFGEAIVWLGWALFYKSAAVFTGMLILCAAFSRVVRWEERRLLDQFGDSYRAYLAEVPRWVGFTPRPGQPLTFPGHP